MNEDLPTPAPIATDKPAKNRFKFLELRFDIHKFIEQKFNINVPKFLAREFEIPEVRHSFSTEVLETIRFIIIALIIVVPIRLFIAQPFIVSGASMDPTFASGQYLIVDELSYRLGDPVRGDVIVFKYPRNPKQYFIKRLIGLPGETVTINEKGIVTIQDSKGTVIITMNEPYVKFTKADSLTTILGSGEYFMAGDNRAGSFDSRDWGAVPRENIIGRAFIRLLPLPTIDFLPGVFNQ